MWFNRRWKLEVNGNQWFAMIALTALFIEIVILIPREPTGDVRRGGKLREKSQ